MKSPPDYTARVEVEFQPAIEVGDTYLWLKEPTITEVRVVGYVAHKIDGILWPDEPLWVNQPLVFHSANFVLEYPEFLISPGKLPFATNEKATCS